MTSTKSFIIAGALSLCSVAVVLPPAVFARDGGTTPETEQSPAPVIQNPFRPSGSNSTSSFGSQFGTQFGTQFGGQFGGSATQPGTSTQGGSDNGQTQTPPDSATNWSEFNKQQQQTIQQKRQQFTNTQQQFGQKMSQFMKQRNQQRTQLIQACVQQQKTLLKQYSQQVQDLRKQFRQSFSITRDKQASGPGTLSGKLTLPPRPTMPNCSQQAQQFNKETQQERQTILKEQSNAERSVLGLSTLVPFN